MNRLIIAIVVAIGTLATAMAGASDVTVEHVWARATPKGAATGVVYLTLLNTGKSDDRLLGASSPVAEKIQFHSMTDDNGVMKMDELSAIDLQPGASTTLKPGGIHMMLTGMKQQLKEGQSFPLTLMFEKADPISTTALVGKIGAMAAPDPHSGD